MRLIASILLVLSLASAHAQTVTLTLPKKVVARAEYLAGKPDKPAVLILHGFLQTHAFPTVQRLSDSLHDAGYTVLAPTLTLGITNRRQSMACEAIHTHTLQDDQREIEAWLNWLKQKTQAPIVLVGHSTGSFMILSDLKKLSDARIRKFIGISLVEGRFGASENDRRQLMQDLQARIKGGDRHPISKPFSFCKKFFATPESLHSYLEWDSVRLIKAIKASTIQVSFIMAGKDDLIASGWIGDLQKTGKPVHVIQGANHFMDGEHEFDLLDMILAEL